MTELIRRVIDLASPLLEEAGLDEVLRLVRDREGIDLRDYRRNTVQRRVTSRLQKMRCEDYLDYAALLARDPEESRHLLAHVTIKVSRFFRDSPVFARLRDQVLPDLISRNGLRIWSAGCGNGEEAYSLSILLEEMARERPGALAATIWATDVDEGALAAARRGQYSKDALAETPPELIDAYFARREGRFTPQYEIATRPRQRISFLHHNLLSATTPPKGLSFDLVLCRNVLIYFERPAQERVINLLASSITPGGYLCLGEAEQLPRHQQAEFETIDRQARVYRRHSPASKGNGSHVAQGD